MKFPDHSEYAHSIDDFLLEEKLPWAENPSVILVTFRVMEEHGVVYKIVSVGRKHTTMVSIMSELQPSKYFILDGVGGLMGELMNMSIMFGIHEVEYSKKDFVLEYTVWLNRLEPGQESNIDADMVERLSRKICDNDTYDDNP